MTNEMVVPESIDLLAERRFQGLSKIPPEIEWFANIENPNTRAAYQCDLTDFMRFFGMTDIARFREVNRAHVIAWRNELKERGERPNTIRRRLSALSSLFDYLCAPRSGRRRSSAAS